MDVDAAVVVALAVVGAVVVDVDVGADGVVGGSGLESDCCWSLMMEDQ